MVIWKVSIKNDSILRIPQNIMIAFTVVFSYLDNLQVV